MALPAVPNNRLAYEGQRASRLKLEDVQIGYRNFEGREGMYNREGDRNFAVVTPSEEQAQELKAQGWNIKWPKPMADGTPSDKLPTMQVSISYKNRPPRIVMITSAGRTTLQEDELILLDWADIRSADMMINPYHYNVNGSSGIKAYAQSVFIIIEEDPLELKYADLPELGMGGVNELEAGVNDRMSQVDGNGDIHTAVQVNDVDGDTEIFEGELVD